MAEPNQVFTTAFDLITHIERQREFSERTFGPGLRTEGVSDHIRKELLEIAAAPRDLSEWVDVILLALDGAWRAGYTPIEICEAIGHKQRKNEMRKWPDWRTAPLGKAIEHDRAAHETSPMLPCDKCGRGVDEHVGIGMPCSETTPVREP